MSGSVRSIDRVLVANRGEIARRVFATCRRLGLGTVAVFSEPDATAMFAQEADVAVALGGATPAESYLRGDAIVAAALRAGADAVHPGYGFLAENADFARAVAAAGLTWIGPSPEAIEAMGSKLRARALMEAAGVPVLPGAALAPGDDLHAAARRVGYPLLVKASAGGGGKGMREVAGPDALEAAVAAAAREAGSAFGDDTVFLERFVGRSRHVEIQIMGDAHGTVVALHERDCSVQRRHQKVIEEAPSPALDPALREAMGAAAIAAGRAIDYAGAGTVEFLVAIGDDGRPDGFFFLEVNTRLQVEHPVTELVTGLDLVELQLLVAAGEPLPAAARDAPLHGHAIEARLYAEDARNGFLPQTGTLSRLELGDGVRVDTGVRSGSEISPYYDPLIAKVVAHGATRAIAARRLADALARARVQGTITNRDFLVRVLRHPEFLAGAADTSFLARHDLAALSAPLLDAGTTALCAAALALARQQARRDAAPALGSLPSGWRNNPSAPQRATFATDGGDELTITYMFDRAGALAGLRAGVHELPAPRLHACSASLVDLEVDGVRRRYDVAGDVVGTAAGEVVLRERPRFPDRTGEVAAGSLTSPMPGAVLRVLAAAGESVIAGQPLVVVEAMKMEHEITAPVAGVLAELHVAAGAQVEAGAVLARIDDQEDES